MNRIAITLCLTTLALAPGCLGDDPELRETGPLVPDKPGATTIGNAAPDSTVLNGLVPTIGGIIEGSSRIPRGPADGGFKSLGDSPQIVTAPELCGDCTVTLVHSIEADATDQFVVFDDQGYELCQLAVRTSATGVRAILVDDCGLFSKM